MGVAALSHMIMTSGTEVVHTCQELLWFVRNCSPMAQQVLLGMLNVHSVVFTWTILLLFIVSMSTATALDNDMSSSSNTTLTIRGAATLADYDDYPSTTTPTTENIVLFIRSRRNIRSGEEDEKVCCVCLEDLKYPPPIFWPCAHSVCCLPCTCRIIETSNLITTSTITTSTEDYDDDVTTTATTISATTADNNIYDDVEGNNVSFPCPICRTPVQRVLLTAPMTTVPSSCSSSPNQSPRHETAYTPDTFHEEQE